MRSRLAVRRLPTREPCRRERARDGVGYLTPGTFSFSRTSDRGRLKGLPGARLVSNAVNISHVEGALPGLDAARLLTGGQHSQVGRGGAEFASSGGHQPGPWQVTAGEL